MKLNLNIQNNLSDVINNIDSEIEAERTKRLQQVAMSINRIANDSVVDPAAFSPELL